MKPAKIILSKGKYFYILKEYLYPKHVQILKRNLLSSDPQKAGKKPFPHEPRLTIVLTH